jgi:hypothetical protein
MFYRTCLTVFALVLSSTAALCPAQPSVSDVVVGVSQSRYGTYQVAVQDMGLGLYGGSAYNQGYRDRDGLAGPGSLGNQEARLYLQDQFASMGLGVTTQGSYLSVVGQLMGTVTPSTVYIVCGHYDHMGGTVASPRPGGDDNASGTAGVLEAARVLSGYLFESTIRFIGFNAEEDGLLGSKEYVGAVKAAGENIAGVINLDMILRPASDITGTPPWVIDLDLVTRTSHAGSVSWANLFRSTAATYAPSLTVDATISNFAGGSDQDPFVANGYSAFLAIENTVGEVQGGHNAYYHGPGDANDAAAGAKYDYAFATDVVRATVAMIAQEAGVVPEPASMAILAAGAILAAIRRQSTKITRRTH